MPSEKRMTDRTSMAEQSQPSYQSQDIHIRPESPTEEGEVNDNLDIKFESL